MFKSHHHATNFADHNKNNAVKYVAHMVFNEHMMIKDANFANAKIHAVATYAQMTQNVLSTFHKSIHHLHQFAVNVSGKIRGYFPYEFPSIT